MEIDEKIKKLGRSHSFGIRKLIIVGNSYAITLPKFWVDMYCTRIDGEYYLKLKVIGGDLLFGAIKPEDVEHIRMK